MIRKKQGFCPLGRQTTAENYVNQKGELRGKNVGNTSSKTGNMREAMKNAAKAARQKTPRIRLPQMHHQTFGQIVP